LGQSIKNPLAIGESIAGLTSSIFGIKMPSMCDLSLKLDQILSELSIIKNRVELLTNDIQCTHHKNYVQTLKNLAFRFQLHIKTHTNFMNETKGKDNSFSRKLKQEKLNKTLNLCNDNSEGIGKGLSEFQRIFFDHNEMKNLFENCARYQRDKVDDVMETFKLIYVQMVTAIRFCSEAEYGSDIMHDSFPYKKFEKDVNSHIEYYLEYLLPFEFAKDKSEIGMEKQIKYIANQYTEASDARSHLTRTFSNYDWTVIYYPDHVAGFDMHTFYAFQSVEKDNYASGSIMFMRKLTNKKNALIAWKLKSSYVTWRNNDDINLESVFPMSDARATADFIWRHNTNLNFLLTFITKESYSKAGYFKIGRSFAGILLGFGGIIPTSIANRHAIVYRVKKPKFPELYFFHLSKNVHSIK
jgi:hypothetical protein